MIDLRALAHDVIENSDTDDLADMVTALLARIDEDDLRDALQQTLRAYVRETIRNRRNAPLRLVEDDRPAPQPQRSWRVAGARAIARQHRLTDLYHVGAAQWKRLGEMTYDELTFAAEERRQIAKRNQAQADLLDTLAALVARHKAKRLGDLPADVLAAALGESAA